MHRAQGKPQPDAHGWRELEGETAKSERVNDRKITADGKEGPGDLIPASAEDTPHDLQTTPDMKRS
ncbi:hypothetical protein [Escherichia coli]|uniref:hypothetical protein n=1 Tax=Escherichia coli TaxID=562 RepID=UPI0032E9313A